MKNLFIILATLTFGLNAAASIIKGTQDNRGKVEISKTPAKSTQLKLLVNIDDDFVAEEQITTALNSEQNLDESEEYPIE